jgi:hypothetical protein
VLAVALAVAGCGTTPQHTAAGAPAPAAARRAAFARYLARIEPLRRGVNRLLDGADPILEGFRDRRLAAPAAARRMARLERRFARTGRAVAAIRGSWPALDRLQRTYARTYPLEEAYLRALAAAIPRRAFGRLPHTEARQRAALVAWRVGIERMARRLGVRLPADVQAAGRGEIAPSPDGS